MTSPGCRAAHRGLEEPTGRAVTELAQKGALSGRRNRSCGTFSRTQLQRWSAVGGSLAGWLAAGNSI